MAMTMTMPPLAVPQRHQIPKTNIKLILLALICCLTCSIWNDHNKARHLLDTYVERIHDFEYSSTNPAEWTSSSTSSTAGTTAHAKETKKNEYPFTIGACLLTKDDKQILPEWLAYHYTVLPLRHLIVAIDPLSITTPEPIFEKFRSSTEMEIDIWKGHSYFIDGPLPTQKLKNFDPTNYTKDHALDMHRRRQASFYTRCLQRFRKTPNISWVALLDTDEYFTYNSILPTEQQEAATSADNKTSLLLQSKYPVRSSLPRVMGKQNETIAHYLHDTVEKGRTIASPSQQLTNQTLCMVYTILTFAGVDNPNDIALYSKATGHKISGQLPLHDNNHHNISSLISQNSSSSSKAVPPGFDVKMFHSLRFQIHQPIHHKLIPGKSLVNVNNYDGKLMVSNPHRPLDDKCDNDVFIDRERDYPFRVHHSSGSLETFLSRPERNVAYWLKKNKFKISEEQTDPHSMSEWLHEFVKLVGIRNAYELTQAAREAAYKESMDIKYRVEVLNESISPVFDWDWWW